MRAPEGGRTAVKGLSWRRPFSGGGGDCSLCPRGVKLFFAPEGVDSFFRRLGLPMRVGSRGNGAALRQAPFAGEPEGTPVRSSPLLFRFGVRVSVGGVSFFDLCLYRTNLEAKPALIPMLKAIHLASIHYGDYLRVLPFYCLKQRDRERETEREREIGVATFSRERCRARAAGGHGGGGSGGVRG